ncbi:hypothetical protein BH10PSE16_BH10PSE16_13270 [soil metagenome]
MTRARKWLLGAGMGAGLLALLAVVLLSLIPTDEELARRAATELEAALGVPASVGTLHWHLLPSPRVELENVATGQPQPIEIKKITAYLSGSALWRRRLRVEHAVVQGAVLPQLSLHGLGHPSAAATPGAQQNFTVDEVPLARIEFSDVTWISRYGTRILCDGEADFDTGWRPGTAQLRRPGVNPPADLALVRQGLDDRWEVRARLGGGTADGELQLHTSDKGGWRLTGQLQSRNIEAGGALQAFNRRAIVAGTASGKTTLSASGDSLGELAQSLHTTTAFTMGRSTLLRFDLDKAIRSLGREHAGQTPLDAISGQIDTQNTSQGMVVELSRLKTSSGVLSASGKARIASQRINAELAVDLVDGVAGIPLTLSGPVDNVQVSVPASALAGAAVGSTVLPGIGTAIGARIGAAIGKLFGREPAAGPQPAPGKN